MTAPAGNDAGSRVAADLQRARDADRRGDLLHTAFALLFAGLLALSTAPKDIAFAALVACATVRLPWTWRCYATFWRDGIWWMLAAWTAWTALSAAWSADPVQGLVELRAHRFVLAGFALWPVVDRSRWLIVAFLVGVAIQNGVQVMQGLGWLGFEPGANARLRGLLHPIHTGTLCSMAMCWHLSAAMGSRRGLVVALAAAGGLAALGGLVLCGSRGPWIAAAVTIPPMLAWLTWRRAPRRGLAIIALAIVAAAAAWPVAGSMITRRAAQARDDLRTAADEQFASDVGRRIASWITAWRVFGGAPIAGVGAGGFEAAAADAGYGEYLVGARHAHSTYLHALACTGVIGGALLGAVVAMACRRAWRAPPQGALSDGSFWALLAWLVAASFDAYQLAGQMFGVLALVVAVTHPCARRSPRAGTLATDLRERPVG